jgi:NAD(P)-dependent dehydrogenase (short-subunit alcohol dehydrogenase family)
MIEAGRGGAIVLTSSTAGLKGGVSPGRWLDGKTDSGLPYTASKHAVVGVMRGLAVGLAPHSIRVNTVHPTGVDTPSLRLRLPLTSYRPDHRGATPSGSEPWRLPTAAARSARGTVRIELTDRLEGFEDRYNQTA